MADKANGIASGSRGAVWLDLALLAGLAAAVRLVGFSGSLWLDELFTAWVVLGADGTMAERAATGNAAVPFYWLVKASVTLFGTSEWAVRLPSVAFGIAVPLVAYALGRSVTGSAWGGRVAGLLVALDGLCTAYATEARPYPVVQFFGTLQLLAFWTLHQGGSGRWRVVYVLSTVAVGYMHFTGLALLGGEAAYYLLLRLRGERPPYTIGRVVLDLAIAGVGLLPLVPLILTIASRKANFDISAKPVGLEDLIVLHRLPTYIFLPAVAAAVVAFARRGNSEPPRAWVGPFMFLLVVFYATAGPLWAAHRVGGPTLYRVRYTTILYLLPMVTVGLATIAWPGRWARVTFVLVALALGQVTEGAWRRITASGSSRLTHDDWRGAVRYANERAAPTAPVFVRAGLIETDAYLKTETPMMRSYLTLTVQTVYPMTATDRPVRPLTFAGDFATDADVELVRSAGQAWVMVQGEPEVADRVASLMLKRLAGSGVTAEVTDRKGYRNVTALRVVVKRASP